MTRQRSHQSLNFKERGVRQLSLLRDGIAFNLDGPDELILFVPLVHDLIGGT